MQGLTLGQGYNGANPAHPAHHPAAQFVQGPLGYQMVSPHYLLNLYEFLHCQSSKASQSSIDQTKSISLTLDIGKVFQYKVCCCRCTLGPAPPPSLTWTPSSPRPPPPSPLQWSRSSLDQSQNGDSPTETEVLVTQTPTPTVNTFLSRLARSLLCCPLSPRTTSAANNWRFQLPTQNYTEAELGSSCSLLTTSNTSRLTVSQECYE